jgi:4-amino-4-deoxy-L-arabinose transferase-like glycosyltransferase
VEPLRHFFIQENLARAFDPIYDSRRGPLFYPASYLLMGLPWSPLLPLAAWRLRRQRGPQVLLCQVLVVWAALSLSRGKIEYYLLPLYPAVSLLVGRLLTDAEWRQRAAPLMRALAIIWALVAAGVAALLLQLPSEAPRAPGRLALFAAACLAGAFVLLAIARRPMPGPLLAGGAGMLLSGFAAAQFWFLPLLEAGRPNPAVRAAIRAELARAPDLRLVLCHDPTRVERELLIHERLVAEQRCDLEQAAAGAGSLLLLLHDEEIERLAGRTDLEEIGRWGFLPVKTLQQLAQGRPVVARRVALVRRPAAAQP